MAVLHKPSFALSSTLMVLNPKDGIAKSAIRNNRSVRDELIERGILTTEEIDRYMNPYAMT